MTEKTEARLDSNHTFEQQCTAIVYLIISAVQYSHWWTMGDKHIYIIRNAVVVLQCPHFAISKLCQHRGTIIIHTIDSNTTVVQVVHIIRQTFKCCINHTVVVVASNKDFVPIRKVT